MPSIESNFYQYNNEIRREEFRKYLEKGGVMDTVTKALVKLYDEPERPDNAIDYMIKAIGGATKEDIQECKYELANYLEQIKNLEAEIDEIKLKQEAEKAAKAEE